jgi:hypothetical protein
MKNYELPVKKFNEMSLLDISAYLYGYFIIGIHSLNSILLILASVISMSLVLFGLSLLLIPFSAFMCRWALGYKEMALKKRNTKISDYAPSFFIFIFSVIPIVIINIKNKEYLWL